MLMNILDSKYYLICFNVNNSMCLVLFLLFFEIQYKSRVRVSLLVLIKSVIDLFLVDCTFLFHMFCTKFAHFIFGYKAVEISGGSRVYFDLGYDLYEEDKKDNHLEPYLDYATKGMSELNKTLLLNIVNRVVENNV